jgi:two-component system chemotaxis response regulator CheB
VIRVLIVDDSPTMAGLLRAILSQESDFQVIGEAKNGEQAIKMNASLRPDLLTMDIRMPVLDGFKATQQIMQQQPVPIVVVSTEANNHELQTAFRAIEAGALAVVEKPCGGADAACVAARRELVQTLRAMAEVKVVRHRPRRPPAPPPPINASAATTPTLELLAIGCSTGGPQALHEMVSRLDATFPLPIVVAQHIAKGFIGGLATWLGQAGSLRISLAAQGMALQPGTLYLAPDDYQLRIFRSHGKLIAQLSEDPPVNGFRPSATPLLQSAAAACPGTAVGGLLTGMGADGAAGLLAMHRCGCPTFVQGERSCVVFGMPETALQLGAVDYVVEAPEIAAHLIHLIQNRPLTPKPIGKNPAAERNETA